MKPSSPAPDDSRRQLEPLGDLDVALTLGCVEDQPGALHLAVRARVARRHVLERRPLLRRQNDLRGSTRHRRTDSSKAT
jgi:hypothetical protein